MPSEQDGVMVILSSPSGAGKTTLVKLLSKLDKFDISISHTTRQPRASEKPNKDYYFVNEDEFNRLIKNQEFLEYAKVFNNFYGTTRTPVIEEAQDQATQWLWTYNNDRPNMGIGGITPAMKLKMAA